MKAEVYAHGATLTSVTTAEGQELLFVSGSSAFDGSKPIRGGVPLVFPKFGPGWDGAGSPDALPSHGFARRSSWALATDGGTAHSDGVTFELTPAGVPEEYRALWPHPFRLLYTVELGPAGFRTALTVENAGPAPFEFQALLHTYYAVAAVEAVRVSGLGGKRFVDKLLPADVNVVEQPAGDLAITAETDRIYQDAAGTVRVDGLAGPAGSAAVVIEASGGRADCVVWNPWIAKAKAMGDFGDDEYHRMVCIEPGFVAGPRSLAPGERWTLSQDVRLSRPAPL